jgi:hypothetical protein
MHFDIWNPYEIRVEEIHLVHRKIDVYIDYGHIEEKK